jgi:hypothetical protein
MADGAPPAKRVRPSSPIVANVAILHMEQIEDAGN